MSKKTTEREALQNELVDKQAELADLMAELRAFPILAETTPASARPPTPRQTEVRSLIGVLESRIRSLTDLLAEFDQDSKAEAFTLAGASAGDEIKRAQALIATAADAAARLMQRRKQVVAKGEQFRSASAAQLELAQSAEQTAITSYARAVSQGDESAQASAQADITAAQADIVEAQRLASAQQVVIVALDAELVALDEELVAVGDRAEEAREALCSALRARYAAQWEEALADLEQAASRYCEAVKLTGSYYPGFSRLVLPRLDPSRSPVYFSHLPPADLSEIDRKTREHLASLFTGNGNRVEALRRPI